MSDPLPTDAAPAPPAGRVSGLAPDPETGRMRFATFDAADADAVVRAGGKVFTKQEVKDRETQEAYDKQSTGTKIATVASMAGPIAYPLHAYLRGQGAVLPPELEAYTQGVSQGFTGGAASVGMKELVGAVGGEKAAHAYGQTAADTVEAHGGLHTAGELAGFLGGAVAGGAKAGLGTAGKLIPGVGISAAGGLAEAGAARVLAPIAARGAIGRALATGGELAARGAVEGGLYGAAGSITEDMLGDKEVAADKLYAATGTGALYGGLGGAALGAGGSLAASGVRGVRSGISRALATTTDAAADAAGTVTADVTKAADDVAAKTAAVPDALTGAAAQVGVKPDAEVSALRKMLSGQGDEAARGAANTMAYDALNATKTVAKKINETVKGGTDAVGEYVNRRILKTAADDATLLGTVRGGRADQLLPLIQADRAAIGSSIGDAVAATPVRVAESDLLAKAGAIFKDMASDPTRIQGAKAFQEQVSLSLDALRNGGKIIGEPGNGTMDLAEMYYARAKMEKVAYEMKRSNSAAGGAMKDWLRDVDGYLVDKLDEAATAMGDTGAKDRLLGLKREYQLSAAAEKAAQEGSDRIAGNNTFGIREGIGAMAGLAMGHPIAALGAAVGGKVLRERGSAAGAYLLTKMADMGTLTRAMRHVDDAIGRSAKGLLQPPVARALPEAASAEPLRARAARIMNRVAAIQANPEQYADAVAQHTAAMGTNAPNLASGLSQRLVSAAAFMASKMPIQGPPDPFESHPAASLNDAQASAIVRYDSYVEKPMRFFDEVAAGKITYEGVEVAKALMPGAFAELQQRTIAGLADLMAQGKKPPYAQRERLGILLDIPATPSQRPDHMRLLQANVAGPPVKTPTPPQMGPKRPYAMKNQPSALDRLEGK